MNWLFWFASADAEDRTDDLALHCASYQAHTWNGFHVPLVTAAEYRRWLAAWGVNDPNGEWTGATVIEGDGALIALWLDEHRDVFTVAGLVGGVPVYGITGYTWAEPVAMAHNEIGVES